MVTSTSSAAFVRAEAASAWTIPVKNTFINFDIPLLPQGARVRATSCPTSPSPHGLDHSAAIQELCHAMAPRHRQVESRTVAAGSRSHRLANRGSVSPGDKSGRARPATGAEVDWISEVSTNVSDGCSPDSPKSTVGALTPVHQESQVALPPQQETQWTSVPGKKTKTRVSNQPLVANSDHPTPAWSTTPKPKGHAGREDAPYDKKYEGKGKGKGGLSKFQRIEDGIEGKGKGKGGLSNFQRIEVGIEDDRDFRVVQRLIGPKGRHMHDIVTEAKGAKVWIIGRGSRSWEDDEGPLMVCVGAMSRSVFDVAVGLVRELLAKVRKDCDKFNLRA